MLGSCRTSCGSAGGLQEVFERLSSIGGAAGSTGGAGNLEELLGVQEGCRRCLSG